MNPSLSFQVNQNIAILTINRPKALNAINAEVMEGLHQFFTEGYKEHPQLEGVIVMGSGNKAFAAGADIKEFTILTKEEAVKKSKFGHDTYFAIERFHLPVIAVVNGFALGGGCELAMACHLRIASEHAKFGQPEVNLGLVPGYGGTQRLIQLIGKGKALELLMTADMIDANQALKLGLVNHVVPVGTALKMIKKIGTKGPTAIKETIRLVNKYFENGNFAFEEEWKTFGELMLSDECEEGVKAFIEKRKAKFSRS